MADEIQLQIPRAKFRLRVKNMRPRKGRFSFVLDLFTFRGLRCVFGVFAAKCVYWYTRTYYYIRGAFITAHETYFKRHSVYPYKHDILGHAYMHTNDARIASYCNLSKTLTIIYVYIQASARIFLRSYCVESRRDSSEWNRAKAFESIGEPEKPFKTRGWLDWKPKKNLRENQTLDLFDTSTAWKKR